MDWLNPSHTEPIFEQITITAEATAPSNPSSIALTFVGVVTLLAVDWTRRLQTKHRKPAVIKPAVIDTERKEAA